MKLENGFLALAILGTLLLPKTSHAVIYADQEAVTANESEDENQDAVSRFGGSEGQNKNAHVKAMKPLDPISENSFAQDSSRAPASVVESSSRGPAGIKTAEKSARNAISKKAIISRAKREKSYQEVAVIANDTGFYPSTLFLTQGIPARIFITGASAKSQCFMLDQFGVRRQVRSQKIEEITFVPDAVGTFTFSCPMNGAKGSVIVKDLEVDGRVPASVSVSHTRESAPVVVPIETKKTEIQDDDFTPEFRN
jgi:hypothetical protein